MITDFFERANPWSIAAISVAMAVIAIVIGTTQATIYGPPPEQFDPLEYCLRIHGDIADCGQYLGTHTN